MLKSIENAVLIQTKLFFFFWKNFRFKFWTPLSTFNVLKKCIWGHNKFERDINSLLQGMINPVWSPECLSSPFLFNHLKILFSEYKTKIKTMILYLMKFDNKNSVGSFKVKRNLRSIYTSSRYWIWHSRRRGTVVEIRVDMWL